MLKSALVAAAMRSGGMEIQMFEIRLNAAKNGLGDPANAPAFEAKIADLKDKLTRTAQISPTDYAIPESKTVSITVTQPYNYCSILELDNITRSGPFCHIAGISGDDFSVLKPGKINTP